jgi:hypothetical protein
MRKIFLLFLLLFIAGYSAFADAITIKHFVVKENPFASGEVAIVATDTLNQVQENVSGVFLFTINGLDDTIKFEKGTGFIRHKIMNSTFIYVKHENVTGIHSKLYYIYKNNDTLSAFSISWVWLLVVPTILALFGYLFKKFIVLAIIILMVFFYFNYHNGLSLPTFFESIIDGLRGAFG